MVIYKELADIVGEEAIIQSEPLKKHTTFRIGGPAEFFITPESSTQLSRVITFCKENGVPCVVLGNGSNVLAPDEGLLGVVLCTKKLNRFTWLEENVIEAECGITLSALASEITKKEMTGFEFAAGIPGTLGGAVLMNAGAYGGEIKDVLVSAKTITKDGVEKTYTKEELQLGYRSSIIQENGEIVLSATFALKKGNHETIVSTIREMNEKRRDKQPLEHGSAGSTFKRPEGYFAGKLIEDAGLKGYRVGDVMVSDKHCGFVVNVGDGTKEQAMDVISHVQEEVKSKFNVELELEVRLL